MPIELRQDAWSRVLSLLKRMHANAVEMDLYDYTDFESAPSEPQPGRRPRPKHDAHAA